MENSAPSLKIFRTKFSTSALYNGRNKNQRQNPVWEFTAVYNDTQIRVIDPEICTKIIKKWKTQSKISTHYTWLLHGKNCSPQRCYLRIFGTGSKPSRRFSKKKSKEKRKCEKKITKIKKSKDIGHFPINMLISAYAQAKWKERHAVTLQMPFWADWSYFGLFPAWKSPKCPKKCVFGKKKNCKSQWVKTSYSIKETKVQTLGAKSHQVQSQMVQNPYPLRHTICPPPPPLREDNNPVCPERNFCSLYDKESYT